MRQAYEEWSEWEGTPAFWLPVEHRGVVASSDGKTWFVGCRDGRVLFIRRTSVST